MRKQEKAQVIVIAGILLMVLLLILAVILDGSRLMIEKQTLERAADSSGKAGLIPVADRMVTQVVAAQTAAATQIGMPAGPTWTPGPTSTETPAPSDFYGWLDDHHRNTLVAPPMRTAVASHALAHAEQNGVGLSNPDILQVEVNYPYQYHAGDRVIRIHLLIRRKVRIVFGSLLGMDEGEISGETKQSLPQR